MYLQHLTKSFPHFHRVGKISPVDLCGKLFLTKNFPQEKVVFHRIAEVFHRGLWKFSPFIFNNLSEFSTFPQGPNTTTIYTQYVNRIVVVKISKALMKIFRKGE